MTSTASAQTETRELKQWGARRLLRNGGLQRVLRDASRFRVTCLTHLGTLALHTITFQGVQGDREVRNKASYSLAPQMEGERV